MSTETAGGVSRIGARGYLAIGGASGLLGFLVLPIIFGPLAMGCGVQLYRRHSEWYGLAMVAWGATSLVVGWVIGLLAWGV
jgi:uncharacterized membrane protein YozB (DUF420 family)